MYAFAVDWDGVCVENAWPEMGDWIPGATEGLRRLTELGTVIIHTCRVAPVDVHVQGDRNIVVRDEALVAGEILAIKKKLKRRGLEDIEVWTRNYKPPAAVYIDDRGWRFENWHDTMDFVHGLVESKPSVLTGETT
jgi:hypothetical protein